MARLPDQFIDDVLSRTNIEDVVGAVVPLRKAGKEFSACCPFHDEKTPSFTVTPQKQFYKCFGCGASGNAIGFLMDYHRLDFREAVEQLAKDAGMEMPKDDAPAKPVDPALKQAPHVLSAAARHFFTSLTHHDAVVEYLKARGISGETTARFGIGYAAGDLRAAFNGQYGNDVLMAASLLSETGDHPAYFFEFFRKRLMFPVRDHRGHIVAFGGRVLDADSKAPKYKNSRDSDIFNKSDVLYGLYEARKHTQQLDQLLVVEGYMDVVALHEHDITFAVAGMGTSFTEQQLKRCYRTVDDVVFCFDGDKAGVDAAKRVIPLLGDYLADGKSAGFIFLPVTGEKVEKGGELVDVWHDPDSFVKAHGREAFIKQLDEAVEIDEAIVRLAAHCVKKPDSIRGKNTIIKHVRALIGEYTDSPAQKLIIKAVAKAVGLTVKELDLPRTPSSAGPKNGGEGVALTDGFVQRYALVEGTTQVQDSITGKVLKKMEFIAQVGKGAAAVWFERGDKRIVSEIDAWGCEQDNPIERYVYLYPTEEVWDKVGRQTIPVKSLKVALADRYSYWVNSREREQIDFDCLVFDPKGEHDGQVGYINKFNGLEMVPADEYEARVSGYAAAQPIIDLIDHLCNGDEEAARWVTRWLAYPLQHIGAKMDTSLLFHGEVEGSGKTLLFSKIMGRIYGRYFGEFGQAQLDSSWNGWQAERLYGVFDEVVSRKEKYSGIGQLKQMVTAEKVVVERKFREGQIEANHLNAIFLSNEDMPFPISSFDRRWFVMWPRNTLPVQQQKALDAALEGDGVEVFYQYLLDVPLGDFNQRTKPDMNADKQRLIDFGRTGWEVFFDEWKQKDLDVPFAACLAMDLFGAYQKWCSEAHFRCMNRNQFIMNIGKRILHKKLRYREPGDDDKSRQRWFFIPEDDEQISKEMADGKSLEDWATHKVVQFRAAMNGVAMCQENA